MMKKLSLADTQKRRAKLPSDGVKAAKITEKVLEFIVLSGLGG